jgi:hypothetical protein
MIRRETQKIYPAYTYYSRDKELKQEFGRCLYIRVYNNVWCWEWTTEQRKGMPPFDIGTGIWSGGSRVTERHHAIRHCIVQPFFFLEGGLLNLSRICARPDGLNLSAARIAFSCVFEVITPVHPLSLSLALAGTDFHLIKSIWTETTCADNSPFRRDYHRPCHFVGYSTTIFFFLFFSIQDRSWSGHLVDAVITKWRRPSTIERSGEKALPNAAKWTILVRKAHATGKCERKMCCVA